CRADAGQTDLRRVVLTGTGPGLKKLALHETDLKVIEQRRAEGVEVGGEKALDAHVGIGGQRVGYRGSVRTGIPRESVVDVVARRNAIVIVETMIQLPHDDVPAQVQVAVGQEVIGAVRASVAVGYGPKGAGCPGYGIDQAGRNDVSGEGL